MVASEVELSATYNGGELDLEEFVQNATWRELLMQLVDTHQLDPWDIDLSRIVDSYMHVIKRMKVLELQVPANIMLAASILLRMKSDTISVFEQPQEEAAADEIRQERVIPEVPALMPRARLQPGRKVTLDELMEALGDAIKITERRETIIKQKAIPLNMVINKEDIDEKIERAYGLVSKNIDKEGYTTFDRISRLFGSESAVLLDLFVPLLFLSHQGKVSLMQENFFDEIFIKLNKGNGNA